MHELNILPKGELRKVLAYTYFVSFKTGKLTTIEAVLNIFKIIHGLFLYTHFQMVKGK